MDQIRAAKAKKLRVDRMKDIGTTSVPMKMFRCSTCNTPLFFENRQCSTCHRELGFLPDTGWISAIECEPDSGPFWTALLNNKRYRQCANATNHHICNWMIDAGDPDAFCISCRLVQTIPNLSAPRNRERWHNVEIAKRRVIYTLLELGLPFESDASRGLPALTFRFLGGMAGQMPVLTSHNGGMITIDVTEADDDERERRRISLHEPYRTLVGHIRHESGHYYWNRFIAGGAWLERFRQLFGDESRNYDLALRSYYEQGADKDWASRCVSAYASAHPWEDWAETWAHYLNIVDTIETAHEFGITAERDEGEITQLPNAPTNNRRPDSCFEEVMNKWLPLTRALNMLNRGMGLPDLYPFVLSEKAIEKLKFIHDVVSTFSPRGTTTVLSQNRNESRGILGGPLRTEVNS